MKKTVLFSSLLAVAWCVLLCTSCKDKPNGGDDADSLQTDSLNLPVQVADSTVWGRLGEGTSMSVYEFITDDGDTLQLLRTSNEGEDGIVLGDINPEADRFAVCIGHRGEEGSECIRTLINTTQLMGVWKAEGRQLTLSVGGDAYSNVSGYSGWQLVNGKLVLRGTMTTEYGETDRIDTMRISWLDKDTLKLITPQHEEIAFGR